MYNPKRMPPYFSAPSGSSNPGSLEPGNTGMNNYGAPQNGANIIPGTTLPNNQPPQNQRYGQRNNDGSNYQPPQNPQPQNQRNGQQNNVGYNQPPQNPQPPQNQGNNQRNNGGYDRQPSQKPKPQNQRNGQQNNGSYNQPPQNPQPPQRQVNGQQSDSGDAEVNAQIYRIDDVDKLIDFHSNLVAAHLKDYANLHGRGGSKYAPKSTINVKICDYSRGTNDGNVKKSVTVNYPVCWQDFELFLDRAIRAENGELYPPFGQQRAPGEPWLSFSEEKNHGFYKTNPDGTAPVVKIEIHYTPIAKDGSLSSYPWFIAISNFDAPIQKRDNGAISHKSKQAKNMRKAYINVSALEFRRAMVAVVHHIRNWESAMTLGNIRQGVKLMDQQREAFKAANK